MSNLYSITHSQEAMRRLFRVGHDLTSNLPPLPAVYPDTMGADCSHRTRWRELAFHIVLGLLAATESWQCRLPAFDEVLRDHQRWCRPGFIKSIRLYRSRMRTPKA